ncbi:MAG: hypothetical protein PGN13_01000 [Patulibacter minatonensis]
MSPDTDERTPPTPLATYLDEFGARYSEAVDAPPAGGAAAPARAGRSRRRRPRWRTGLVLAGVCSAVAGGATAVLTAGPVDVVAAASAALGERGAIAHYSFRADITFGDADTIRTRCSAPTLTEVWQTTSGPPRSRTLEHAPPAGCPGRIYAGDPNGTPGEMEIAVADGVQTAYIPALDRLDRHALPTREAADSRPLPGIAPTDGDPVRRLRAALADGRLRETGRTARGAHDLIVLEGRVRSTTRGGRPPSGTITVNTLRYLVDASSYAPVELTTSDTTRMFKGNGRTRDGSFESGTTVRFEEYEVLPMTPTSERLLEIHPPRPTTTTPPRRTSPPGRASPHEPG